MAKARPALLGTSLLLLSCFGTTGAPPPAHTFPVRTYTLASGLRIVVEQDDTSRLVGIAWVVGVGHEDDPPPHPGLAHLVEHLLYTAPDATGVSTWRRLIDLGASENAQTDLDLTTAFAFAPRAALDELVEVFLDRVEEPGVGIDEALIAKERHVIDQEVTLRESQGRAGLRLAVDALAGRPLIHDPADVRAALGAITLDDVRGFLATHYRPERMTLILSGPLGDEWDQRFLAMLPPALAGTAAQRRPPVRRPLAAAGRVGRRPEITTALADVRERELWLAWPVAPARGKDVVPMQMLAALADGVL